MRVKPRLDQSLSFNNRVCECGKDNISQIEFSGRVMEDEHDFIQVICGDCGKSRYVSQVALQAKREKKKK